MDHAPLELFEFESVLALDFLLGDVHNLLEVALEHLDAFSFFADDTPQTLFIRPQFLLELVDLVFETVTLLGDLVELLSHLPADLGEDALDVVHRRGMLLSHLLHARSGL